MRGAAAHQLVEVVQVATAVAQVAVQELEVVVLEGRKPLFPGDALQLVVARETGEVDANPAGVVLGVAGALDAGGPAAAGFDPCADEVVIGGRGGAAVRGVRHGVLCNLRRAWCKTRAGHAGVERSVGAEGRVGRLKGCWSLAARAWLRARPRRRSRGNATWRRSRSPPF